MSAEKPVRTFLYVEPKDGYLLATKRSADFDFTIRTDAFKTIEIKTTDEVLPGEAFTTTYSVEKGFLKPPPPDEKKLESLRLLKKKVDTLILIKMNLNFVVKDISLAFSAEAMKQMPLRGKGFRVYWLLMCQEKKILLRRLRSFFREMKSQILDANSVDQVNERYTWMVQNVNIGVYSVTNRERKNIGHIVK